MPDIATRLTYTIETHNNVAVHEGAVEPIPGVFQFTSRQELEAVRQEIDQVRVRSVHGKLDPRVRHRIHPRGNPEQSARHEHGPRHAPSRERLLGAARIPGGADDCAGEHGGPERKREQVVRERRRPRQVDGEPAGHPDARVQDRSTPGRPAADPREEGDRQQRQKEREVPDNPGGDPKHRGPDDSAVERIRPRVRSLREPERCVRPSKRAQVSRFSVDRRSIASQPTETRTRTRLVSFVAWASSNVTAASVSSPARLTDRAALAAAAVARSDRPIHVICSGSAFERV